MAPSIDGPRIATHLARDMGPRVLSVLTPTPTPTISMSAPDEDPMEGTSPTSPDSHARSHHGHSQSHGLHAQQQQQQQQQPTRPDAQPSSSSSSSNAEHHPSNNGSGPGGSQNNKTNNNSNNSSSNNNNNSSSSGSMPAPPTTTSSGSVQTKVVQTAFIHKLYSMLEDSSISHLISWSEAGDSFVMSPSADFSKVLSQYFKHTNISSFVRQLNMYGFHKERDVFHTGHPESTLWEFKHGNGSFKRGDLLGLREIKRRASRHALVHRDNTFPKTTASLPGTPAEPMPMPPEGADSRLAGLDHTVYDLSTRLQRSDEAAQYMHVRNQVMADTIGRMLHINSELSRTLLSLFPPESQQYRDIANIQTDFQKEAEALKSYEQHNHDPYAANRPQYFGGTGNAPTSPRQMAQDDPRRVHLAPPQPHPPAMYRPPLTSNLSTGSRRPYGSISGGASATGNPATHSSPLRNTTNAPPPERHLLGKVDLPGNLARRHTSADIREHGWPPAPRPYPPGNPAPAPGPWPSSPGRGGAEVQGLRDSLATYTLHPSASMAPDHSRPTTPPGPPFPQHGGAGNGGDTFGNWSWGSATRDKLGVKPDTSAPPTRRGSMAHILNPSDTAERSDEDEDQRGEDDRKRQRMQ